MPETVRIDNTAIRIDTALPIRIDMDLETAASTARAQRYTSPAGGKMPMIWRGRFQ